MAYYKEQREYAKLNLPIRRGIRLGSKRTAYYKDEMMYGRITLSYKVSELAEAETNILYGKNEENNINKQLDSSGNNE